MKLIYLYIIECSDGTYYTGVTNNLEKRILQHNLGINKDAYTHNRRPVKLVFHEPFADFTLAFNWETRIKKWSKLKKEALIRGEYNSLKMLSKKNFSK
ncbi:MAG: GIY-YIG nuclease family protein [Sphingobacteriaceae bacterium]|nr:GIY-YIG nuclease family protein [Sphingobacteriaceae bacterium]